MAAREPLYVRSYRSVLDAVERRVYRIDRWRLPMPGGVGVRAVLYVVAMAVAVAVTTRLPVVGPLVGLVPASIRFVGLPVLAGWGLSTWRIDGRPPHCALISAGRYAFRAKTLSGLRRAPACGSSSLVIERIQLAPAGDEASYRRGRIRGPARLILRYPAVLQVERRVGRRGGRGLAGATKVSIRAGAPGRALSPGHELAVPTGGAVIFR